MPKHEKSPRHEEPETREKSAARKKRFTRLLAVVAIFAAIGGANHVIENSDAKNSASEEENYSVSMQPSKNSETEK